MIWYLLIVTHIIWLCAQRHDWLKFWKFMTWSVHSSFQIAEISRSTWSIYLLLVSMRQCTYEMITKSPNAIDSCEFDILVFKCIDIFPGHKTLEHVLVVTIILWKTILSWAIKENGVEYLSGVVWPDESAKLQRLSQSSVKEI